MLRTSLPYVALFCCGLIRESEPFRLKLVDLSDVWFPGGAVIRLPSDKCSEIQVLLAKPWSEETRVDQLALRMDQAYPRFIRLTSGEGNVLSIRTREPRGLLTHARHVLAASTMTAAPIEAEWTILQWDKAYVESTKVTAYGTPLAIRIDRPPGGVVVASAGVPGVRVAGEVSGGMDTRLSIDGDPTPPLAGQPGFRFDRRVSIVPGAKEMIVTAVDEQGDSTVLALRVLSDAGN